MVEVTMVNPCRILAAVDKSGHVRAVDKLRVRWCRRERDMLALYPLGSQTSSDGGWLLHALGPILEELERRGYDKTTLRVSIEPARGNTRFASQRVEPSAP